MDFLIRLMGLIINGVSTSTAQTLNNLDRKERAAKINGGLSDEQREYIQKSRDQARDLHQKAEYYSEMHKNLKSEYYKR